MKRLLKSLENLELGKDTEMCAVLQKGTKMHDISAEIVWISDSQILNLYNISRPNIYMIVNGKFMNKKTKPKQNNNPT